MLTSTLGRLLSFATFFCLKEAKVKRLNRHTNKQNNICLKMASHWKECALEKEPARLATLTFLHHDLFNNIRYCNGKKNYKCPSILEDHCFYTLQGFFHLVVDRLESFCKSLLLKDLAVITTSGHHLFKMMSFVFKVNFPYSNFPVQSPLV
ncbi:hypothetical protein XENOCAPTIV_020237 [Xenoophorus captivus]|uniref:Uncharacterized protein n=1 Tax=Xenoophorus captivus TaxID=1517983 RepID=A0ABV0QMB4_9TELE